ncbi:MAG: hypothetical protein ACK5AZ_04040 [Bryobacteraceae bacterium]
MATLATLYDRFFSARNPAETATEARRRESANYFRLRPLPNEDVHFFIKKIDNTRVVREADPAARSTCWHFIIGACMASILLIGMLLPSAYSLLAGYQIEQLKQEHQQLLNLKTSLELEEAKLLSPERLEELARIQQLVDPAPGKVVYLDGKNSSSVAMNVGRR